MTRILCFLLMLGWLTFSSGCSTGPTGPDQSTPLCATGQLLCDGACVEASSNVAHCGACGHACSAGQTCEAGSCRCVAGLALCGSACVDTSSDAGNCGSCGSACVAPEVCSLGQCSTQCAAGLTPCGQSCVDTLASGLHCGSCGSACAPGQVCLAGTCQCPIGQTDCAGRCTDTNLDVQNCGACGNPCASGQTCNASVCTPQATTGGVSTTAGATDLGSGGTTSAVSTTSGAEATTTAGGSSGTTTGSLATASTDSGGSAGSGTGGATNANTTGGSTTSGSTTGGSTSGGSTTSGHVDVPFILGADISYVQELEDQGAIFSDGGVQKQMLELLRDHGFNYIRLRLFHTPGNPGGYAADRSEPYCDTAHTLEMAQRVKAQGMGLLLDFHYSDTWADPGTQRKPAAWESLSFDQLVTAVYDYTRDTLLAFQAAGATPDMVQVGNEISPGMLHPDGHTFDPNNWDQLAQLLTAGLSAVKEVDPEILTMLHLDRGGDLDTNVWWLDEAYSRGVQFDVLGESNYTVWQGQPNDWTTVFAELSQRYPGISFAIVEYNGEKRAANDVVRNIPDGRGLGTFFWEPTESGAWGNAIFNWSGNTASTIASDFAIFDQIADDYGLR